MFSSHGKDTVERPGYAGEVQRPGEQAGVSGLAAGTSAHEPPKLRLTGPSALRRLLLEPAKRAKLSLVPDHLLDRGGTQRADQFVLQVSDAHEETVALQADPARQRSQAGPLQTSPETTLCRRITQTGQPDVTPARAEQIQEVPEAGRTPHRHDADTLAAQITAAAGGECFERDLIADPLDEHDRIPASGHLACCHRNRCGVSATSRAGSR